MTQNPRDHGGGIDAARRIYGGSRIAWADLSTGINPVPFVPRPVPQEDWTALPDTQATTTLLHHARHFWHVPAGADILAAPGASALIAQLPRLAVAGTVHIPQPTYNEHAAAFAAQNWTVTQDAHADAQVVVHPNNPTGILWAEAGLPVQNAKLTIIDESFCDVAPDRSLIAHAAATDTIILKSFGKFWGLAGLRLGFAIGAPALIAQLRSHLGPWAVSGPALRIGADALADPQWAENTRQRLTQDATRLDDLMRTAGAAVVGGTTLFRLYDVGDAAAWQHRLAQHYIWSRIFPYNAKWLRLGLPHPLHWARLEAALA